jgi:hypothetical protein
LRSRPSRTTATALCKHSQRPSRLETIAAIADLHSTFLKRKGGLFKKAHELSVLCSVDVAVIIFGHNKKLYEFSSGDINETIGRYQYVRQSHWLRM